MHTAEVFDLIQKSAASPSHTNQLAQMLNHLVLHDFESLVQLLYRVDVPEQKIRQLLQNNPGTDAGLLLAELLVRRQHEKEAAKKSTQNNDSDIPEAERW